MISNKLNIWGPGQILAFSGLDGSTDYNNGLVLRTAFEWIGFEVKLPDKGGSIRIKNFKKDTENFILTGDFFQFGKTQGVFIDAWHILIEGEIQVKIGKSLEILCANDKILIGLKKRFRPELLTQEIDEAISERFEKLKNMPFPSRLTESSDKTLWKAYSQLCTQFCSPEGNIKHLWTTPDRWPHRKMWLWDSVFHAAGIRHVNINNAREVLTAMLECIDKDGCIPHMAGPFEKSKITQPPILALGAKLIEDIAPDMDWLKKYYPKLKSYILWDMHHRDSDNSGLVEWFIEADENCRCGESGMDNSPRFDMATQLKATDFNSFLSHECEILSEFADKLGLRDDAAMWKKEHKRLNKLINEKLWNKDERFYFDLDVISGTQTDIMASSGFFPLICGAASQEQAESLAAHLENPATFKTAFPVPSIAVSSDKFYSKDMWRGPVWINVNWLIIKGLQRYELNEAAAKLRKKTIEEIEKQYLKYGTFFEFYDDRCEVDPPKLLRKSLNKPNTFNQVFHDYGWTATLYIDFVFEMA